MTRRVRVVNHPPAVGTKPSAQFPAAVFDGLSANRLLNQISPPDQYDYDQLVAEIQALQSALSIGNWIALTLSGSWTNGAQAPASYKVVGNQIRLKGVVGPGTKTDATTIFTLPAGARPASTLSFYLPASIATVDSTARLVIASDGTAKVYGVDNAVTALDLSGVSFFTDQ